MNRDKGKGKAYSSRTSADAACRIFNRDVPESEGRYVAYPSDGRFLVRFMPVDADMDDIMDDDVPLKTTGSDSWSPGNTLAIPEHYKDKDYKYSFRNPLKPGRLNKLITEGWEIDKELSKKGFMTNNVDNGKQIDGASYVGGLIVMRIHKDKARSRKEYFRKKTRQQTESAVNSIHGDGNVNAYVPDGHTSALKVEH